MFLTGPGVVREVIGEDVAKQELGGPRVHARNGVCHLVADDDAEAAILVARPARLPAPAAGRAPPGGRRAAAAERATPARSCPPRRARSTTCATWSAACSTAASCSRSPRAGRATWSRRFARIDGRPVGVVANQPRHLGGVIDAAPPRRRARFVQHVQRLRPAARGARRHARLPARHAPGGRGRDPPRRRRCCTRSPRPRCPR